VSRYIHNHNAVFVIYHEVSLDGQRRGQRGGEDADDDEEDARPLAPRHLRSQQQHRDRAGEDRHRRVEYREY
jgi:hypothetical protein